MTPLWLDLYCLTLSGPLLPPVPAHQVAYHRQIHRADSRLHSARGVSTVLTALEENPAVVALYLGHSRLSDDEASELARRVRRVGARVEEAILTGNCIGDRGLLQIVEHWLGHRSHLRRLLLNANQISLASPSPIVNLCGNLTFLSLSSNPLSPPHLEAILLHPAFSPAHLETLQLSACQLPYSSARAIASWLCASERCASLLWLSVNGNRWGDRGSACITYALARPDSPNTSLMGDVEMLACGTEETFPADTPLGDSEREGWERDPMWEKQTWRDILQLAVHRNRIVVYAAQRAAVGVLPCARALLLSPPSNPLSVAKEEGPKGWYRLPVELQVEVLCWLALYLAYPRLDPAPSPSPAHSSSASITNNATSVQPSSEAVTPSAANYASVTPLSDSQLHRILSYCSTPTTLPAATPSSDHMQNRPLAPGVENVNAEQDARLRMLWKQDYLRRVGCQRFEGRLPTNYQVGTLLRYLLDTRGEATR